MQSWRPHQQWIKPWKKSSRWWLRYEGGEGEAAEDEAGLLHTRVPCRVPVRRGRGNQGKSRYQSSGGLSDESRRDLPVEDDDSEEANEDCETVGSRNIDEVNRGGSEEATDNHEEDVNNDD